MPAGLDLSEPSPEREKVLSHKASTGENNLKERADSLQLKTVLFSKTGSPSIKIDRSENLTFFPAVSIMFTAAAASSQIKKLSIIRLFSAA